MLSKRESQLIELLLEEENFQPASFFSEKLNVSNKTIYQDIQKLGQFLNRFELKIEKKPRMGIYLIGTSTKKNDAKIFITSKEAMSTKVKYSSNYRRVYLFANLIFKTDKKRYEYFEKKFFVSIATLRKDYEEIIKYCRLAGIRITSNGSVAKF
ncbi:helix-turn-helix domain-containing protein [Enterococcus faecium]|uniref:helix-turn-helix domain-containing protein n=1 Tax=Enterococcus faecium TaxID=1352 RepID=UPI001E57DEF3|nr:helix-turn-helix domain-containing protein [Enterococcus faecium]